MKAYEPVIARVFARSPSTWYSTVEINKGSSDGVRPDQPVINGEGLVGKVKSVSDGNAIVMLLTDQDFGVSAKAARSGEPGLARPRRRRARRPAARARPARQARHARASASSPPARSRRG